MPNRDRSRASAEAGDGGKTAISQLDPLERATFIEVIRHLRRGVSSEEIARVMDLPASTVNAILVNEAFCRFFEAFDESAFQTWREARSSEASEEEVQTFLRSNALRNVKRLQEMVDGAELDSKPETRAAYLEKLIKMAGVGRDEDAVQLVKISPTHMAALHAGAIEVDSREREAL